MSQKQAKLSKTQALLKRMKWAFFSSRLPVGRSALDAFQAETLEAYGILDMPSYRQAIATMIMHMPPNQDRVRRSLIARQIRKAQANQVAYECINDIRQAEKEKPAVEVLEPEQKQQQKAETTA